MKIEQSKISIWSLTTSCVSIIPFETLREGHWRECLNVFCPLIWYCITAGTFSSYLSVDFYDYCSCLLVCPATFSGPWCIFVELVSMDVACSCRLPIRSVCHRSTFFWQVGRATGILFVGIGRDVDIVDPSHTNYLDSVHTFPVPSFIIFVYYYFTNSSLSVFSSVLST